MNMMMASLNSILIFMVVFVCTGAELSVSPLNASKALNEILQTYDRKIRPFSNTGPASVKLQISIAHIGPINEMDFTFRIDYFMREWWVDDRLTFPGGHVTFNGNPKDLIWLPDLFIRNSKTILKHGGNTDTIRTTVYHNGSVYMSSRISAINSCNMDLHNYPMDQQVCKMTFESYAYNSDDLNIQWHKNPIEYNHDEMQIEGYKLEHITTTNDSVSYITGDIFPLLTINIHVQRTVSYYLFRSYVPSSFLVVMTWGTFWLPVTTYPARVGLIVTNFLASAFILQRASSMYSKVPYTTAIEVFFVVNLTFIMAVMIEFICVIQTPNFNFNLFKWKSKNTSVGSSTDEKKSHVLDSASRVLFPIMYCTFLIVYFVQFSS